MKPTQIFSTVALLALGTFGCGSSSKSPVTEKQPVTDTYHGVEVVDDYRWLEDWNDERVKQWSEMQNTSARKVLDNVPNVAAIRHRVTEIMSARTVGYSSVALRDGQYFAIKSQPPKQQPFLVVMPSPFQPDQARVLLDPNEIDGEGTTAIDWYEPSPDGKLVAVSLSHGGDETGDVHVYETATGKSVFEIVPRVNSGTAGGDMAWHPDGRRILLHTAPPTG